MDIKSKEERSRNMSAIKNKDTKPEIKLRKILTAGGFKYRLHKKDLPGKPDLYLSRYKTAVFVHGCYWHRHENCKFAYTPKSNTDFWSAKFEENVNRDRVKINQLIQMSFRVIVVWECTLEKIDTEEQINEFLNTFKCSLLSAQTYIEI